MKKILTILLLVSSGLRAQVPFEYIDEDVYSYLNRVLTNDAGKKWLIIRDVIQDEGITLEALLYDLKEINASFTRKKIIENQFKKQKKNELAQEELDQFEIPLRFVNGKKQIDSVINALKANAKPISGNFNENFKYQIDLKKIDSTIISYRPGLKVRISEYDLNFINGKGELVVTDNFISQYLSKEELDDFFSKAMCWKQKDKAFGRVYYFYTDIRGESQYRLPVIYNR
jgi:hypothetical protein